MTDRTQIDSRTLVSLTPLRNIVCLNRIFETYEFFIFRAVIFDLDTSCIHKYYFPLTFSHDLGTWITSNLRFDTSTNDWSIRTQQRNSLAHHVRSHQCTVSIVMFQERNQRSCNGSDLLRSYVHQIDLRRRHDREISFKTSFHSITNKLTVIIQWSIPLGNRQFFFFFCSVIL